MLNRWNFLKTGFYEGIKFGLLLSFSTRPLGKLLLFGIPLVLLMGKELGGWLRPKTPVPPVDKPQAAG